MTCGSSNESSPTCTQRPARSRSCEVPHPSMRPSTSHRAFAPDRRMPDWPRTVKSTWRCRRTLGRRAPYTAAETSLSTLHALGPVTETSSRVDGLGRALVGCGRSSWPTAGRSMPSSCSPRANRDHRDGRIARRLVELRSDAFLQHVMACRPARLAHHGAGPLPGRPPPGDRRFRAHARRISAARSGITGRCSSAVWSTRSASRC